MVSLSAMTKESPPEVAQAVERIAGPADRLGRVAHAQAELRVVAEVRAPITLAR